MCGKSVCIGCMLCMLLVCFASVSFAATITGSVVNPKGEPVACANVLVEGSRKGTTTDLDGKFILEDVGGTDITLIISHLSYPTTIIEVEMVDGNVSVGKIAFSEGASVIGEPVVVTATRTFHRVKDAPAQISVVSNDEMNNAKVESIADALHFTPGVNISGGAPGAATRRFTMMFQGLPAQYSLVLLNGKKLLSEHIHTGVNLNTFAVTSVERLEVMSGAASSQYGAEALGGVLNIIPIAPGQGPLARVGYDYGTYSTNRLNIFHSKQVTRKFAYNINADYEISNGGEADVSDPDRYSLGYNRWDVLLQTKILLSSRFIMDMDYYHTQQVSNKDKYAIEDKELDVKKNDMMFTPSLKLTWLQSRSSLSLNSYLSTFEYDYKHTLNRKWNTDLEYVVNLNKNYSVIAGLNSELSSFQRKGTMEITDGDTAGYSRTAFGAFAQGEIKAIDNLTALASVRFDYTQDIESSFNPKLSLAYAAAPDIRIKASVGTGTKVPVLQELYEVHYHHKRTVEGQTEYYYRDGNPDLIPENSINMTLAAEWYMGQNMFFGITGYRNNLTDMIDLVYIGDESDTINYEPLEIWQRQNMQKAYTQGFQIDAVVRPTKMFRLGVNYSYMSSEADRKDAEGNIFTTRLAFSPTHSVNIRGGFEYPLNKFKLGLFAKYSHSMDRFYYDSKEWAEKKLDDYQLLEAGISVAYTDRVEFYVKGSNLMDLELTTYEEGKQATAGGRYFTTGVRLKY